MSVCLDVCLNVVKLFFKSHTVYIGFSRNLAHMITCANAETRGQSNLTKSASRGAHSPVRGHPKESKFVPLNSWGRGSY